MKVSDERAREIRTEAASLVGAGVAKPVDKLMLDFLDDRDELIERVKEAEKRASNVRKVSDIHKARAEVETQRALKAEARLIEEREIAMENEARWGRAERSERLALDQQLETEARLRAAEDVVKRARALHDTGFDLAERRESREVGNERMRPLIRELHEALRHYDEAVGE